ncbi:hypothetical protein Pelo_1285 [Pelomyxa schiedti]|nr:hypothetical protein Pelo_1285 [Pelomyxa schiedti]
MYKERELPCTHEIINSLRALSYKNCCLAKNPHYILPSSQFSAWRCNDAAGINKAALKAISFVPVFLNPRLVDIFEMYSLLDWSVRNFRVPGGNRSRLHCLGCIAWSRNEQ